MNNNNTEPFKIRKPKNNNNNDNDKIFPPQSYMSPIKKPRSFPPQSYNSPFPKSYNSPFPKSYNSPLPKSYNSPTPKSYNSSLSTTPVKNNNLNKLFIKKLLEKNKLIQQYPDYLTNKSFNLDSNDRKNIKDNKSFWENKLNLNNLKLLLSNNNSSSNTRGTSGLIYSATYLDDIVVIKFIKDSIFATYEIMVTQFLSDKNITPHLFNSGEIIINNEKYYYLISEKYDGDFAQISGKSAYKRNKKEHQRNLEFLYKDFMNSIPGKIIKHGDLSPTNFVYKDEGQDDIKFKIIDFNAVLLVDDNSQLLSALSLFR
jgi:hypothetical protein